MWRQTAALSLSYPPVVQKHRSMALLPEGNKNLRWKVFYILHSLHRWLQVHSSPALKCTDVSFWKFNKKLDGRQISLSPTARWVFHSTFESKFCFLLQTPSTQCLTQLRWEEKVKQGIFWTTYFKRTRSSWSIKSMFTGTKHRGENNSQEPWVILNKAWMDTV